MVMNSVEKKIGGVPVSKGHAEGVNKQYVTECYSGYKKIDFYCKNCKKSMRMSYCLCGDDNAPAMNGIILKCHTHKCTRVITLKRFTEGQIKKKTEPSGKCYL